MLHLYPDASRYNTGHVLIDTRMPVVCTSNARAVGLFHYETTIGSLHAEGKPDMSRHVAPPHFSSTIRRAGARHTDWQALLLVLAFLIGGGYLWSYANPALIPDAVDQVRAIVGPEAVAQVETWVFQVQDLTRQALYQTTGTQPALQWAAVPAAAPRALAARTVPPVSRAQSVTSVPALQAPTPASVAPLAPATSLQAPPIHATLWSPFIAASDGQPILERAMVAPDPTRPYVETAIVRINLRATQLHLVAGTLDPHSAVAMRRPGAIPLVDQRAGYLLAAFNGGFRAIHGSFGMATDGVTLLPPRDGLATLALYHDGRVRLGEWGKDLSNTPDLIAFRQNCPLLLNGGTPTAATQIDDPTIWGKTVKNRVAIWRSGLGLSADGQYLMYAAGDGLTVPSLAQALAQAGADRAMQLDINSYWPRFVTYAATSDGTGLVAEKLLTTMVGDERLFLAPNRRDFFYVTTR